MLNMQIWYLKIIILHSMTLSICLLNVGVRINCLFPKVIVYFEKLWKVYSLLFRY